MQTEVDQARKELAVWAAECVRQRSIVAKDHAVYESSLRTLVYLEGEAASHRARLEDARRQNAIEMVNAGRGTKEPF